VSETSRPVLTGLELAELEQEVQTLGEERYRARQVLQWVYRRNAGSFDVMSDVPAIARDKFSRAFDVTSGLVEQRSRSRDGTVKLLGRLKDGDFIETVLIPDEGRRTICISTQVGCPVKCGFCASGIGGLRRQLRASEIVDQIVHMRRGLDGDERISNVVLMGIGEPLLNYNNVARALRIMKAAWGLNIGYNKITLSTVGIVDKIYELLEDRVTPNLAISLHAPNEEIREQLIPTMKKYSIHELVKAGIEYRDRARKEVTFEYVLLEGVNDEKKHALQLGKRLAGQKVKVNVIPFNPVPEFGFRSPSQDRLDRFVRALGGCGVFVTVRRRRGGDIDAACGQLRARALAEQKP
jgi:23S rRNA (adenine2503-C2)-methyltransferase